MEERELVAIINQELASSIGHYSGDLASSRALELKYYFSEPFGNEVEGESQVVSSDVFDTVEGMLPALLRIFTASDDVVKFEPEGPEDEEKAAQRTDVVNYVFHRQNNGFLILYEWFKDALIQKNGIVKYYWEEKISTSKEEYKDLSEGQYLKLISEEGYAQNEGVEVLEHSEREDETAKESKDNALNEALKQLSLKRLPPEVLQAEKTRIIQAFEQLKVPTLHDVTVRIRKDKSKICVETVAPEEFRISQKQSCISIQDTSFCAHQTRKTKSYLREMGCPEDVLERSGSSDTISTMDSNQEALARDRFLDERPQQIVETDPSTREVDVVDGFLKVDDDGDGVAELRHFIKVGSAIWVNEECDHINFAALTPIIMPHRWVGMSAAELVMSDQFTKSVIWRQMLNNLYLTNNPRKAVLSSASGVVQANLDDLMNSRAGAIVREYVQGAVRNEETPFVAGAAFPMLEYIDSQKETRTGQTRYSQGTDADTLNKTARGIQMIQSAGQQRLELIARIFAETGVKDLMKGIAYCLSRYASKAMTVRLRNKWVEVDPREWKTQFDMSVNVGLGTGNKDVQISHIDRMGAAQIELIKGGRGYMVSDENIYNLYRKRAEAMGFKHPEIFVSDPQTVRKPPPQPNPDVLKVQTEAQIDQAKIQSNEKIRQFDAQTQKELETIKSQTQISIAHIKAQVDREIAQMKIDADARLEVYRSNQDKLGEMQALEGEKQEFEVAKKVLAVNQQGYEMKVQSLIDSAMLEVKKIMDQHENKINAALTREKAKSEGRAEGRKPDVSNLEKMHQQLLVMNRDLLSSVAGIAESLGALKNLTGRKTVNVQLPSGGTARAEITPS